MTDNEKSKIIRMRAGGFGYKKIAGELGISESTIKTFIKRCTDICPSCGNPVDGKKKFCSDKCRMLWWRKHPHRTETMTEQSCEHCGKKFFAYDSKKRKYCSRKCYGLSCRKEKPNDKRKVTANCSI